MKGSPAETCNTSVSTELSAAAASSAPQMKRSPQQASSRRPASSTSASNAKLASASPAGPGAARLTSRPNAVQAAKPPMAASPTVRARGRRWRNRFGSLSTMIASPAIISLAEVFLAMK
ncbi:MAG: hypothetical protein DCF30_02855 [Hyphomicrobiales bacterium]|nr:MAG: hypothetical protein DCF30_02855 [Hyphomicrobiales bacterium]